MDKYELMKLFLGTNNVCKIKDENPTLNDEDIMKLVVNVLQMTKNKIDDFSVLLQENYVKCNFMTEIKDYARELKVPSYSELTDMVIGRLVGVFMKKRIFEKEFYKTYIDVLLSSLNNPDNISVDSKDFDLQSPLDYEIKEVKFGREPLL